MFRSVVVAGPQALMGQLRPLLGGRALVHAADADAALWAAQQHQPAVLLLCEGLRGVECPSELLQVWRARPEMAATTVVYHGVRRAEHALRAGADAVVLPGMPPPLLAAQLDNLARRAEQTGALQGTLRDLRGQLAEREREERARDQMVHMLVHDLKNPIGAVRGLIDLVLDGPALGPEERDLLHTAREGTQHLLYLAANMLDVRKMQAGKMNLRRSALHPHMLEGVLRMAQADVGTELGDRHLEVQLPGALPPLHADPEVLRRILTNLISNAVKHTAPGGRIRVRATPEGEQWVCVSVRDDGEGIPEEDLGLLFQDFGQSPATLHGRFDTGMGLAFCRLAVETHGGEIGVRSKSGAGSEFFFTLPVFDRTEDDDYVELLR